MDMTTFETIVGICSLLACIGGILLVNQDVLKVSEAVARGFLAPVVFLIAYSACCSIFEFAYWLWKLTPWSK